jgi:hypothetical protein
MYEGFDYVANLPALRTVFELAAGLHKQYQASPEKRGEQSLAVFATLIKIASLSRLD